MAAPLVLQLDDDRLGLLIGIEALLALFAAHGLKLIREIDSLPYDLSAIVGERTATRTYICRVTS